MKRIAAACSQSEAISKSLMLNGRLHASLAFQLASKALSIFSRQLHCGNTRPGPALPRLPKPRGLPW